MNPIDDLQASKKTHRSLSKDNYGIRFLETFEPWRSDDELADRTAAAFRSLTLPADHQLMVDILLETSHLLDLAAELRRVMAKARSIVVWCGVVLCTGMLTG